MSTRSKAVAHYINMLICRIWNDEKHCNILEFVMRILISVCYGTLLAESKPSYKPAVLNWCWKVYHVYFSFNPVPSLISRILQAFWFCETDSLVKVKKALKYSKLYMKQKANNNLSPLSQAFENWMAKDDIGWSTEWVHIQALHTLQYDIFIHTNTHWPPEYWTYCADLFEGYINNSRFIGDYGFFESTFILYALQAVIIHDRNYLEKKQQNQAYVERIGSLCRLYYKHYKSMDSSVSSTSSKEVIQIACLTLIYYYLDRSQEDKATKWMQRLYETEIKMFGSTHSKLHLLNYTLPTLKQNNYEYLKEFRESRKILKYKDNAYPEFLAVMEKHIKNKTSFVVMRNIIIMKHCNYTKCNRMDLKSYKICNRCKSVFYCCRNHQKKDWKYYHREHCVPRKKRFYEINE